MKHNTTRCLIVDDEPLAIEIIETYLNTLEGFTIVGKCKNALEAYAMLEKETIDLLFLDIQMPQLTGIDFLKSIKNPPKVIFTTAYAEYALEGYELDVLDYLVKPISFDRFFKAITKYNNQSNEVTTTHISEEKIQKDIYVTSNKKKYKIALASILYIESIKDYVQIHTADQRILVKTTLSDFYESLPKAAFLRVHRSFIVHKEHITAYTAKDIEIGKIEIPIGASYKQLVQEALF